MPSSLTLPSQKGMMATYTFGEPKAGTSRRVPPFLARKPIGSMNSLNGIEYLHTVNPDGTPVFMPNESDATPLFLRLSERPTGSGLHGRAWG